MKDALRRDAPIHLLIQTQSLTLEDVAQQVGFRETSTFHRAFKKVDWGYTRFISPTTRLSLIF